ncbi:MAG: flagellar assembly protein FliW [Subdoligranulum sp.]|nr:flagellar assembly protein FliW [Subdoligranulum sp.]
MLIETRDFGKMEIDEKDIITFVEPIFGFEEQRRYVLLEHEELNPHFVWLQSVEEPMVCFVLANPCEIVSDYQVTLPAGAIETLGEGSTLYFVLTVIRDPYYDSTVNLKSPVVINTRTGKAIQVILEEPYPIRQPLVQKEEEA